MLARILLPAAVLCSNVAAQNVLFVDTLEGREYSEAVGTLGYTATVVSQSQWSSMTTAQFASYDAIILGDPYCGDVSQIQFLADNKAVWSPAITGNIIILGTDPAFHSDSQPGAVTLIDDSLNFVVNGSSTGLYFALSCYYGSVPAPTLVDSLTELGNFTVTSASCYNDVHLVASSIALNGLSDADLSNWSCSIHEIFVSYPSSFSILAIANGATGPGAETFADNTTGIPYVLARGVVPSGCGNGIYQPQFNEECDDGGRNGTINDLCSSSCKCIYGVLNSTAGTCNPPPASSTSISVSSSSSTTATYSNTSVTTTSSRTSFSTSTKSNSSSLSTTRSTFTTATSRSTTATSRSTTSTSRSTTSLSSTLARSTSSKITSTTSRRSTTTSTTSTTVSKPSPSDSDPYHFWGCVPSDKYHGKFSHTLSNPGMSPGMCASACKGRSCAATQNNDCYCADFTPGEALGGAASGHGFPCPGNTIGVWWNPHAAAPPYGFPHFGGH